MPKEFPQPVPFRKLLGPSFIILALGLGSGEIILWPYLASNYGLGIAWGALLGITFQFFINMEIERYALAKGESVFVGIFKFAGWAAYWFIFSTFVGFGLPGIIAASASVFSRLIGIQDFKWVAIAMLFLVGFILSAGKTVYGMMEKLTKTVILIGAPFIFILVIFLSKSADWRDLLKGLAGFGDGFNFFPPGIALAVFLGAFAYSGAGGNLNLTQSIYIREKGYGMGKYSQKLSGLFAREAQKQEINLEGESFETNPENLGRFRAWWKSVNLEHLLVFWFIGSVSMLLLMLLAHSTVFGDAGNAQGISFVLKEGAAISQRLFAGAGSLFLLVVSVMLFQTQLGVMDSTSRIMSENFALIKLEKSQDKTAHLSKIYFFFVWAQIVFGTILFLAGVYEPKTLIVLGAVINAFAMFVHIGLVFVLNHRSLPKELRPGILRKAIIAVIFLFFGFFSAVVLLDKLNI